MKIDSHVAFSEGTDSLETGRQMGEEILESVKSQPKVVVTYLTDTHDQHAFINGIADVLGPKIPLLGCSAQGVMTKDKVVEDRYAAAALALGGDGLSIHSGYVEETQKDTLEKGRTLGRTLKSPAGAESPKVLVLHYDPLCGMDVDLFLEGLAKEIHCPIVGAAAAHAFFDAPLEETRQYYGDRIMRNGAVACTISGDFTLELGICHGCSPIGLEMTVTKTSGPYVHEFDNRPTIDVWEELCGTIDEQSVHAHEISIGVPVIGHTGDVDGYVMRAPYHVTREKGVILATHIPEGTKVMLHHRTVEDVLNGATQMGHDLRKRLQGKKVRVAIGFECGARTKPFLGVEGTREENQKLQECVGPNADWIGMMGWGELFPTGQKPTFHNYAYPLLIIAE